VTNEPPRRQERQEFLLLLLVSLAPWRFSDSGAGSTLCPSFCHPVGDRTTRTAQFPQNLGVPKEPHPIDIFQVSMYFEEAKFQILKK
jgi:hypothetical protein